MPEIQPSLTISNLTTQENTSVASSILSSTIPGPFRQSITGEPRGPLCGVGICHECRLTIDGRPHQLSCQSQLHDSSIPFSDESFDVLIVGAGPAGMAAAVRASESGARVGLVDDNSGLGGQIWRNETSQPRTIAARNWFEKLKLANVTFINSTRIIARAGPHALLGESRGNPVTLAYDCLIIATGARERFLPFPGWTLPNVMGAGGLQALVKMGLMIEGKRVVVAGSGPLLVAVAAYLKLKKARVLLIAEQASSWRVARFGLAVAMDPSKRRQALALRSQTIGIPYHLSTWPVKAQGTDNIESVTLTNRRSNRTIACDYLACGFGLVPNHELADLLGCRTLHGRVVVDTFQKTSEAGIFCVGESTGIGGLETALVEGEIAGLAATHQEEQAKVLSRQQRSARAFARVLDESFTLRDELRHLAEPETLVCRCEDVSMMAIASHPNFTSAKIHTRCGMGPCQAKVCGPATSFLFGWNDVSIRPPLAPVSLATLACVDHTGT